MPTVGPPFLVLVEHDGDVRVADQERHSTAEDLKREECDGKRSLRERASDEKSQVYLDHQSKTPRPVRISIPQSRSAQGMAEEGRYQVQVLLLAIKQTRLDVVARQAMPGTENQSKKLWK